MAEFYNKTPSQCPPKGAEPSDGTYYRIVFNNPPLKCDFTIWILEPEYNHLLEEKIKNGDCSSFALSMQTEEGKLRASEIFKRAMKKKAERKQANFMGWARIKLKPELGKLKQTGRNPHHFDFWPYINSVLESNVLSVEGL